MQHASFDPLRGPAAALKLQPGLDSRAPPTREAFCLFREGEPRRARAAWMPRLTCRHPHRYTFFDPSCSRRAMPRAETPRLRLHLRTYVTRFGGGRRARPLWNHADPARQRFVCYATRACGGHPCPTPPTRSTGPRLDGHHGAPLCAFDGAWLGSTAGSRCRMLTSLDWRGGRRGGRGGRG